MITLAFDTCFQACSIAIGQIPHDDRAALNAEPLAHHFEARQKGHAEVLLPLIEEVLKTAELSPSDIDGIAVTNGPGSFTGTRANVAAARGLALALNVPVFATSSLRVMGFTAARKLAASEDAEARQKHRIVVTVDARRDAVYVLSCMPDGSGSDEDVALLSIDRAARLAQDDEIIFVGTGAEVVCAHARALGYSTAEARLPDLQPDAGDLWRMAALGIVQLADPVAPLYMRPADAKPQIGKSIARTTNSNVRNSDSNSVRK